MLDLFLRASLYTHILYQYLNTITLGLQFYQYLYSGARCEYNRFSFWFESKAQSNESEAQSNESKAQSNESEAQSNGESLVKIQHCPATVA